MDNVKKAETKGLLYNIEYQLKIKENKYIFRNKKVD